jgi:hypothetical protein
MPEPKVWVFFYGSYMNLGVLREVDLVPERWEIGRLGGFDTVNSVQASLRKRFAAEQARRAYR